MNHSGQREKWMIYLLAVLLCLVLASFWVMCNIYAKYTASATGSDSARVARFQIMETGTEPKSLTQEFAVNLSPGESETFGVTVTNGSEVAVHYAIKARNLTNNLPLTFQMKKENQVITSDDIPANDGTARNYYLEIDWPMEQADASYAGKTDVIEVILEAAQID